MGVRHSNAAFSKLMMRLMVGNFVDPCPTTHTTDGQTIRENRYEITDVGVLEWTAARKFYLNLSPPSADLVPLTTEQGGAGRLRRRDPPKDHHGPRRQDDQTVRLGHLEKQLNSTPLRRPSRGTDGLDTN